MTEEELIWNDKRSDLQFKRVMPRVFGSSILQSYLLGILSVHKILAVTPRICKDLCEKKWVKSTLGNLALRTSFAKTVSKRVKEKTLQISDWQDFF